MESNHKKKGLEESPQNKYAEGEGQDMYDTTTREVGPNEQPMGPEYVARNTLILGKYLEGNETGGDCEPSMAGQRDERSSSRGAGFDLQGLASREPASWRWGSSPG